ncbi:MAG: hypothetical protein QM749_16545 [Aquabacterium sp.]
MLMTVGFPQNDLKEEPTGAVQTAWGSYCLKTASTTPEMQNASGLGWRCGGVVVLNDELTQSDTREPGTPAGVSQRIRRDRVTEVFMRRSLSVNAMQVKNFTIFSTEGAFYWPK